jgi:hypothetical protein
VCVGIGEEESAIPPALVQLVFGVPGLTLRLRSGQAHWANLFRASGRWVCAQEDIGKRDLRLSRNFD